VGQAARLFDNFNLFGGDKSSPRLSLPGTKAVNPTDAAQAAADQAKKEAEQKALMDAQNQAGVSAARKSLLDTPTSGFGPNTNLARSFLTSL
jgi:hypothetical protein